MKYVNKSHLVFILITIALLVGKYTFSEGWGTDYYSNDPKDKTRLVTVEKHHLSEPFYKAYKSGNYFWAMDDLDFVLRWFPNHPEALSLVGVISIKTKKYSMAIKYFEKGTASFPKYEITWILYGDYCRNIKDYESAIENYNKALTINPNNVFVYEKLARIYEEVGKKNMSILMKNKVKELK